MRVRLERAGLRDEKGNGCFCLSSDACLEAVSTVVSTDFLSDFNATVLS